MLIISIALVFLYGFALPLILVMASAPRGFTSTPSTSVSPVSPPSSATSACSCFPSASPPCFSPRWYAPFPLPHPQNHLKKEYHKTAARTTTYAIAIMAVVYIVMGVVLVMIFADDSASAGKELPVEGTVPGNIISVLPSNSFENIVISIGMVVSLMGSIPLFLEAAGEIVENGMGRSAGRVVIVRSSEVWKDVYREQEAVDYAHRGEPGVVPDRLSVPSFYGHSRFEYPCVARCCQILNGDSEALRRLSLRLRFRRSCIWSSLTRS